ncbi:MAG TPA: VOC family protein [Xanthobacteraceae bacterium]
MAENAQADRQLPLGQEIFLDHVGHFVRDPQAAARALARAGFAPTPLSVQTQPEPESGAPRLTGTGNVTAMLARGYVEVLFKTADTPLGQELDAAIARYPGIHLAAFSVADAERAHQRLGASGFRMRPLVDMQRPVDMGGKLGTAAFTIARLEGGEMPEGRIQLLTHRTEDMVWQPRWLAHPNGALGLTGVVIVVGNLDEAGERFGRLTGRPARVSLLGQSFDLDRGSVDLVTSAMFSHICPHLPIPALPFIGAYGISVRSLDIAHRVLREGEISMQRIGSCLVAAFPQELGRGAWVFSEPKTASADPR